MLTPSYLLSGDFFKYEELFKETFPQLIKFKKGEIIFRLSDDRSQHCYYVLDGVAIFTLEHESGREKGSTFRGKGSVFPLYYTFNKTALEGCLEVRAFTDMTVLKISKKGLYELMLKIPAIAISMCDAWGRYASDLLFISSDQTFETAEIRICNFLYICCHSTELSTANTIRMTHAEIGTAVGLAREQVSRILGYLKKKGVLEISRGNIQIISMEKLRNFCSEMVLATSNTEE